MRHFLLGLALPVVLAAWWWVFRYQADPESVSRWVLEPDEGVMTGMVVVLLGSSVITATRSPMSSWLKDDGLMALGIFIGVTLSLFAIGPGNLWPIVIVLDMFLLAPALVVGAAIGEAVVHLRRIRGC